MSEYVDYVPITPPPGYVLIHPAPRRWFEIGAKRGTVVASSSSAFQLGNDVFFEVPSNDKRFTVTYDHTIYYVINEGDVVAKFETKGAE